MELVSAKTDVIFKMLFTQHENLLRDLLASLLEFSVEKLGEIKYLNTEIPPEAIDGKFSRLDLSIAVDDQLVNIEIQVYRDRDFRARTLYYWAKLYSSELKSGDVYGKLKKTISINIVDFNIFDNNNLHNEIVAVIKDTGQIFTDKFSIHFFELNKLDKTSIQNRSALWLNFINSNSEEEYEMIKQTGDSVINEAVNVIYTMSKDEKIREAARLREKRLHDEISFMTNAREEGMKKGMEQGMKQGMKQGMEQGMKQGMEKGISILALLINKLIQSGRIEDIERATNDISYREQLFKEFLITRDTK